MRHGGRPRLRRGVRLIADPLTGRAILLGPERALLLDGPAHAIVALLDGTRTREEIVLALGAKAPRTRVLADVEAFLEALAARRLVEETPP